MCESVSLLAAGTQDGHHHQGEIKTTESGLANPPPATIGSTPLPSPSPAFVYYADDYRHYDDDSCLQDQEEDGAYQLLEDEEEDGAYQLLEDEEEDVAATGGAGTGSPGSLAGKLGELVRQKLAEVNTSGAVVAGLGLVGSAVGAYFLWPAAAAAAAAATGTMPAPGGAGFLISRVAFAAKPKLYFKILHTAGAAAAAAAFAL